MAQVLGSGRRLPPWIVFELKCPSTGSAWITNCWVSAVVLRLKSLRWWEASAMEFSCDENFVWLPVPVVVLVLMVSVPFELCTTEEDSTTEMPRRGDFLGDCLFLGERLLGFLPFLGLGNLSSPLSEVGTSW